MRTVSLENGFSTLELLGTLAIIGILAAVAVPETSAALADMRLRGDARGIHNSVGLAKMRAAARYTQERVFVDLTTNSYQLQYWDKNNGAWVNESGSTSLSRGVSFGFGTLSTPPPNTQSTIGQSPACTDNAGGAISGTACIKFNSRGIPVDALNGPTGINALYITDGTATYAVTLSATPLVRLWWTPASDAKWVHR